MNSISSEMAAVIHIFTYDHELETWALPYVDQKGRNIDWDAIFSQSFGSGHYAAVRWAYALWRNSTPEELLCESFSMGAGLRRRVLQAIAIRWSMPINDFKALEVA